MAFTDLDEHLAEAFGEQVAEHFDGFGILDKRPNKERYNPGVYEAKEARKAERKHAETVEHHLAALASGAIPGTCEGPECCNLMPIEPPVRGAATTVCSADCMMGRQLAQKHAKRQERHLAGLASGEVPSTCLGPYCFNLMPMALPAHGPAPWLCSEVCRVRLYRWRKKHH
jgi:hypothetical protein